MKSWIAALASFVFPLLLLLDPVWGQNQPLVIEGVQ